MHDMFSGLWKSQDSHSFLSMTHVPIFVRLCSGDLNSSNDVKASIWFYVCFLSYPVSECLGDPCKWLEGNLPQYKTFFLHCNWICRSVIIHVPVTVVWWEPYKILHFLNVLFKYRDLLYQKRHKEKLQNLISMGSQQSSSMAVLWLLQSQAVQIHQTQV